MSERWIVNASPLILLCRIGCERWLTALSDEVVIPAAVAREVTSLTRTDRACELVGSGAIRVVPSPTPPTALLTWDLGSGETEVLALSLGLPGWVAILDDRAARQCASALGVPTRGTLGVVLLAKDRGLVCEARPVVAELRQAGLYLTDTVTNGALALVGE